ncbi:MAG: hydrogenase formation protein [Pseudomonadota bacterium]|jgi:hypothetical protein|nr:nickel-dependent hydrogenase large subunit [Rubrivivax sp.]
MTTDVDLLAGRLTLAPGAAEPIACERPMVGAALLRRLTEGRRAALLPELVGSVFTLCASAQRSTARRAVAAALGLHDEPRRLDAEMQLVALATAREHLQRFALDLPRLLPCEGVEVDASWLRDAPVHALPSAVPDPAAQQAVARALDGWLERRLLGLPAAQWLERWRAAPAQWLAEWSEGWGAGSGAGARRPLARWLAAVQPAAQSIALPCRPLGVLHDGDEGLRRLAAAVAADPQFAERPTWRGAPAETGPWTRRVLGPEGAPAGTAWLRLGARLADLAAIAVDTPLACESLALGPGEGIAATEMSRGLLVHWVRLEPGARSADTARVAQFRVLAPTEWNFHPHGTLARALAGGRLDAAQARLAALALDPCIEFRVREDGHA